MRCPRFPKTNCIEGLQCGRGSCSLRIQLDEQGTAAQANGGAHRLADPVDPKELPTDFQAARDAALRMITERLHIPKVSPEVTAALIISSSILALAEAAQNAAEAMRKFMEVYEKLQPGDEDDEDTHIIAREGGTLCGNDSYDHLDVETSMGADCNLCLLRWKELHRLKQTPKP